MTGYVLKLSYDQDRVSTVGRLRRMGSEALSLDLSASLSLVTESGLRTLHVVVPLHVLESDALEPLCSLSLTSGTKSLPWTAGGRSARSRLGRDRETDWDSGEETSVGVEE